MAQEARDFGFAETSDIVAVTPTGSLLLRPPVARGREEEQEG